jgi:hypothetical protein
MSLPISPEYTLTEDAERERISIVRTYTLEIADQDGRPVGTWRSDAGPKVEINEPADRWRPNNGERRTRVYAIHRAAVVLTWDGEKWNRQERVIAQVFTKRGTPSASERATALTLHQGQREQLPEQILAFLDSHPLPESVLEISEREALPSEIEA